MTSGHEVWRKIRNGDQFELADDLASDKLLIECKDHDELSQNLNQILDVAVENQKKEEAQKDKEGKGK